MKVNFHYINLSDLRTLWLLLLVEREVLCTGLKYLNEKSSNVEKAPTWAKLVGTHAVFEMRTLRKIGDRETILERNGFEPLASTMPLSRSTN